MLSNKRYGMVNFRKFFTWPETSDKFYQRNIIPEQFAYLIKNLAKYMRKCCGELNKETEKFKIYTAVLSRLHDEFEIGIYILNYDNIALSAFPGAFTGFREGKFDGRAVSIRREWNFIYHLHGSVHFFFANAQAAHALVWENDLSSENFKNSDTFDAEYGERVRTNCAYDFDRRRV